MREDVKGTLRNLESLHAILDPLQKSIDARKFKSEERDLVATIESHVKTCEESIQELQDEYGKLRKPDLSRDDIKAAIKCGSRRATYPFRQSTLHKLGEDIDEIKSNLTLALEILGIADNLQIQNDLADVKTTLELVKSQQVSADLENWLKAPDATIDHNNACSKKHQDSNSFMWVKGFAGSGKSVLCSTAIQSVVRHRGTDRSIGVAFFYFKFSDESKQDVPSMLRALLLQLSHQMQDGHVDLLQLQQSYRSGTPPPQALIAYLRRLIERFQDVYIMLDALDESPGDSAREDVLHALDEIRKWNLQGLHLFVTSRNERDIHECFEDVLDGHVTMRNEGIDADIANFVSGSLDQNRSLQKWRKYHEKIREGLAMRAKGVFRWVECQLKLLQRCPCSSAHLDDLLRSLPPSLDATYERMLCNIPSNLERDARRVLTMLCFATRPLTVKELIDAIAVEINEPIGLQKNRRIKDYNDINQICPGFIEVNARTHKTRGSSHGSSIEYVQIAHFSVQEYLVSDRIRGHKAAKFSLDSAAANAEIAQVCLVYLLERDLSAFIERLDRERETYQRGEFTLDSLLENYPLAKFAAESWPQQCKDMTEYSLEVQCLISKLLFQNWTNINWLSLHDKDYPGSLQNIKDLFQQAATPVYYASLLRLHQILQMWFDDWQMQGQDDQLMVPHSAPKPFEMINAEGGFYGYPLVAASARGRYKTVQLLLGQGADINTCGEKGSALYAASRDNHEQVVRLLLDNQVDVNTQGGKFGNALQAASCKDRKEIVEALLKNGADVNAQGGEYGNALRAASIEGSKEVVEVLLKNGADIDTRGGIYFNALQAASSDGRKEVVELLLEKGADINAQGGELGNALQAASSDGRKEVVEVLLEKGADVNAQGGEFGNALQAASYGGSKEIVQLLLGKGADVNAQGGRYGNALKAAQGSSPYMDPQVREEVIRLLRDKGAVEQPRIQIGSASDGE